MTDYFEAVNGTKTEGAANTIAYDNTEIPNSSGADKVWIKRVQIDVDVPTSAAAGLSNCQAVAIAGKTTPTVVDLSQVGAFTTKRIGAYSSAAGVVVAWVQEGPDVYEGPLPVPKHVDGKFYVTTAIKSTGCAGAQTCHYRYEFVIER